MSTRRKLYTVLFLLIALNVIYLSYSSLLFNKYKFDIEGHSEESMKFVLEVDRNIKSSYNVEENCEEDKCRIKINILDESILGEYEIYYNEMLEDKLVLVHEGKIVYPEGMKGQEYLVEYGLLSEKTFHIEESEAIKELLDDELYVILYEGYGKDTLLEHKNYTKKSVEEIEDKMKWLYYGLLK